MTNQPKTNATRLDDAGYSRTTPQHVRCIRELAASGLNRSQIARALEGAGLSPLSRSTVSRILARSRLAGASQTPSQASAQGDVASKDADAVASLPGPALDDLDREAIADAEHAFTPSGEFTRDDIVTAKKEVAIKLRTIAFDPSTPAAVATKAAVELVKLIDAIVVDEAAAARAAARAAAAERDAARGGSR